MPSTQGSAILFDTGSFRDPSGRVFTYEGDLYRAVDEDTWAFFQRLDKEGVLGELMDARLLVETELMPADTTLHQLVPGYAGFMRHQMIPFLSYPYEWSRSMIVAAGQLHLELQGRLLEKGYSLKDASAYNVQFVNGRPIFIDVPSIEVPRRLDIWIAYGQFCRMFLYPLLLQELLGQSPRGYYMAHLDGMEVDDVYQAFGLFGSLRPKLFFDVFLQKHLNSYGTQHADKVSEVATQNRKPGAASAQKVNLERLKSKLDKLGRAKSGDSHWVDYTKTRTYTEAGREAKVKMIEAFLQKQAPACVLDLGCNTGEYSRLSAKHGARVVAVDFDQDSVDQLYRQLKGEDILPIWMDVVNPSPGLGFRNEERKPFLERATFEGVYALALVHHLLVTCRLPLASIRDLLHDLSSRWLIVEYVPRDDEMFRQLMQFRDELYDHFTRDFFEEVFGARFTERQAVEVAESRRVLYLYEKKDA